MSNNNLENVADSTDWLLTPLSGLAAVEAALRCQICKDFYKTPMLTSCNHTFCSLCIRRALSTDGKCPLCRASEQEVKLRSNWSMEEVVAAFTQTRPAVLAFAQRPPPTATGLVSPKRKVDEVEDGEEQQSSSQQRSSKRLRSSARLSKTRGIEATAEMARLETHIPDPEPTNFEPDDGLVACPICWRRMKPLQVDRHLDTSCPGEPQPEPPQQAQSSRPSSSKPTSITSAFPPSSSLSNSRQATIPIPDRLPALNYSMLKEAQLRKELADLGLSTSGNRSMQERRHREWVMIWNANCDSQRPRRRAELLHDLDVWERTLGSRAPTGSRAANSGAQIRDKDFDGAAWATKHDNSFRDLIANARRTRAQAQTKPSKHGLDTDVDLQSTATEGAETNEAERMQPTVKTTDMPVLIGPDHMIIDLTNYHESTPVSKQAGEESESRSQSETVYI
ncbi:DNA repair protein rad18 [Xylariaceae sp. FL1651]|nr:DNA repair protein rad18 [Xylariaceae sp. FL1651]